MELEVQKDLEKALQNFEILDVQDYPKTKKDKIEDKILFLEDRLKAGIGIPTREGINYKFFLEDTLHRENLQDKIMELINLYLQCK